MTSNAARWTGAAALAFLATVATAHGATIVVDVLGDDLDQGPNGTCTLREAIVAANGNSVIDTCTAGDPGFDTIELGPGVHLLTIGGDGEDAAAVGDLDVTEALRIVGAGTTSTGIAADAALGDRVLDVHPGTASFELRALTLRDGDVFGKAGGESTDGGDVEGGCLRILDGDAALDRVLLSACEATGGAGVNGGDARGGALYVAAGSLTLTHTHVNSGRARGGNGLDVAGGGFGGGIFLAAGTATLTDCALTENGASGGYVEEGCQSGDSDAGAVFAAAGSSLTLVRSSLVSNGSLGSPGFRNQGTARIENSTIVNNGGIQCCGEICYLAGRGAINDGTLVLEHVTLFDNARGVFAQPGEGIDNRGTLEARATVFGDNCSGDPVVSLGYNLDVDDDCGLTEPTDLERIDPLLTTERETAPLAWTTAPRPGSPVIDSSDANACPSIDQRGAARPLDGDRDGQAGCDRGAMEIDCSGPDSDGDGIADECDNCAGIPNPRQRDRDGDGYGNECDPEGCGSVGGSASGAASAALLLTALALARRRRRRALKAPQRPTT